MANEYVNKLVVDSEVKFDLTGDTVTAGDLKKGVTAHDKSGAPITGTNENDVNSQDATAAVAEILKNKTAYARGVKLVGTMPDNGAVSGEISAKDGEYTVPLGYHDGAGKVGIAAGEKAKIIPGNIQQGVTVLGVEGTLEPSSDITAQADKAVTPAFTQQIITPDEGYDYLAQVTVAAIPVTETVNAAGGKTLTVGG